ncbi:MAG: hypothetical protein BWY70_00684 [Bacteroidetes bacterium ADurb.Bin408]|nr:MAG: hypothetical protein BWY70_00684 [Bacteroidetes bacterium ADurb.Bin408]
MICNFAFENSRVCCFFTMITTPLPYLSIPAIIKASADKFPDTLAFAYASETPLIYRDSY